MSAVETESQMQVSEQAEELVGKVNDGDREKINGWYKCEVVDIYEKTNSQDELHLKVDVPFGCEVWNYDIPYDWSDSNGFVELVEQFGYNQENFHQLVGDTVLVKPKRNGRNWTIKKKTVEQYQEALENGSVNEGLSSKIPFSISEDVLVGFIGAIVVSVFFRQILLNETSASVMMSGTAMGLVMIYSVLHMVDE